MLLIVHECSLKMLSSKIIVSNATLQTTNKFFGEKPDSCGSPGSLLSLRVLAIPKLKRPLKGKRFQIRDDTMKLQREHLTLPHSNAVLHQLTLFKGWKKIHAYVLRFNVAS